MRISSERLSSIDGFPLGNVTRKMVHPSFSRKIGNFLVHVPDTDTWDADDDTFREIDHTSWDFGYEKVYRLPVSN